MLNTRIKMIGLDLDGTLLNEEKVVSPRTRKALERAIEQGVVVLPATGRPLSGLPKVVLEIPGIRYALTSNGARVLDIKEEKVIVEEILSNEEGLKVFEVLNSFDSFAEAYVNGEGYSDRKQLENLGRYFLGPKMEQYIKDTRIRVDDVHEFLEKNTLGVDKIHALFADFEEKKKAWKLVEEKFPELALTDAIQNNIEVNAPNARKGRSLVSLGEVLGIKREEILAFGDGSNDIDMIKEVGVGVAMANGIQKLKDVADYVTLANTEDGVADFIEKYVLLD